MNLSDRIQQITITEGAGTPSWSHTLETQDYGITIDPVFYTGSPYDEAVSGFLRQNFRGVRPSVSLNWQKSTQASTIRSLYNDLITSFATNNDDYVWFYPDESKSDKFKVILDQGSNYKTEYSGQIGRFQPVVNLISVYPFNDENPDGNTQIPSYLEGP